MHYDLAMDAVPTFTWIGWDDAGAIERVGPEAIVTSFWCVVVPVRAGNSFYRFLTRDGIEARFEIPRQRKSVVLGYVRTPPGFSATILAAPVVFAGRSWWLVPIVAALAGIAAVLTFVVGRLPPQERERRELLRRVSGIGAPPDLIPAPMLDEIRRVSRTPGIELNTATGATRSSLARRARSSSRSPTISRIPDCSRGRART